MSRPRGVRTGAEMPGTLQASSALRLVSSRAVVAASIALSVVVRSTPIVSSGTTVYARLGYAF